MFNYCTSCYNIDFKYPCSHKQSLEDRRGGDEKREKRNPIFLVIESNSNCGTEESETNIAISRNAWDCKAEAGSSALHCKDSESQKYGGMYIGEPGFESPNAMNRNEEEITCSPTNVNPQWIPVWMPIW